MEGREVRLRWGCRCRVRARRFSSARRLCPLSCVLYPSLLVLVWCLVSGGLPFQKIQNVQHETFQDIEHPIFPLTRDAGRSHSFRFLVVNASLCLGSALGTGGCRAPTDYWTCSRLKSAEVSFSNAEITFSSRCIDLEMIPSQVRVPDTNMVDNIINIFYSLK